MYAELTRITCSKCGELGEKYSKTDSWCKRCKKSYIRDYQAKKAEAVRKWKKDYVDRNPEKVAKSKAAYREKNRKVLSEKGKAYQKANSKAVLARTRRYQAAKKKAVPSWADIKAIKSFYENCPKGFHVDHIIPLRGKLVSGLHVLENLQYLKAEDNLKKSNKS